MDGQQQFDKYVWGQKKTVALRATRDFIWANRQRHKLESGGKYTDQYMVAKIVCRAVERAGLKIAAPNTSRYRLGMHYQTNCGVAEEHWWIEVFANRWFTCEICPDWDELLIYGPRVNEPPTRTRVDIPIVSLHQRHVDRIHHVLTNGANEDTPRFGTGYGHS
jgi:hypothetical protein